MSAAMTPPSARPTMRERLLYGVPLLLFFAVAVFITVITPRFERAYDGIADQPLPRLTQAVLGVSHALTAFPYVLTPAMFALAWVYLAWGCRTRRRMIWLALMISVGTAVFIWLVALALWLPKETFGNRLSGNPPEPDFRGRVFACDPRP